jgi:tetratricopeptide (TPR) repeat protein
VASSLFAVHPAHAEAVAWIAGRSDVFCGTFILLSMVLYIRSGQTGSWRLLGLSLIAFILALLTKETAVGLILLFVLFDYLSHPKVLTRENAIRWLFPFLILGIYFWMRNTDISNPGGGIAVQGFFPFEAVLGMITVLSFYLKLMLFPYPLHPFIIAFTASSLFLKLAVVACIGLAGILTLALIRREVVLSFGLFWALIFLGPAGVAGVFGISITPLAERYVYIPSVGFLIAAGGLVLQGLERFAGAAEKLKIKVWVTACLIVIMIVGVWGKDSWSRNAVWRSPVTFWEAAVASSPASSLPYLGLGAHYALLGRYTEAESLYQRAISLAREGEEQDALASGYMYLAELYSTQGKSSEAEPLYRDAIQIWQDTPASNPSHLIIALHSLATIYANQKRYDEAELLYRGAVAAMEKTSSSDLPKGLYSLAKLYEVQGRYAEAEPLFRRSLALREQVWGTGHPAVAFSLRALADLYRNEARYAEAEPLYRQSLATWEKTVGQDNPEFATTLESYAELLKKMKQDSKANNLEARAAEIRNNQAGQHP